jgi:hypothetical protein
MSVLVRVFLSFSAVAAIALGAFADDYQCTSDSGCVALMPGPSGTRQVKFKKGDIVSTSSGWIVNPSEGWNRVD